MKNIPFLSFQKRNNDVKLKLLSEFEEFLDSGWYVLGDRLSSFEEKYANYMGSKYCVGVSTGLDAIRLGLESLGIGVGDEVIVPSNTYIATVLAVTSRGAKPILIEPNIQTYNIDVGRIEEKITSKTKAIIPVHLFGQPCEMNKIMDLASKYGLYIVEDNAQAQGAKCGAQYTGTFGNVNAVSFYPGKNLGALGESGAVTTDDPLVYEKVRALRNYGSIEKYRNKYRGYNNRMDELQSGILSIMLDHLSEWNTERKGIAQRYSLLLEKASEVVLPVVSENVSSVWHQYVIRVSKRDELKEFLLSKGIGTLIHYPIPPHLQECYKELGYARGDFPIAEELARTSLSLPIYPGLRDCDVEFIAECILDYSN